MKKKPSKLTILVLALTLLCGITIGANAADVLQEIKAYIDTGITVTLDGEAQTFTDANGVRVFPITYNGTTYLPVRAVAGLVGLEVNWDQATKTVQLGERGAVDLIDTYKAYDLSSNIDFSATQVQTADKKNEDISGVSYSHWLKFWVRRYEEQGTLSTASFNILGKYETVTFQYYANRTTTLRVLGDNDSVLFETSISGGQVAQNATVPLLGTNQLSFQIEKPDGEWEETHAYVFDAKLA